MRQEGYMRGREEFLASAITSAVGGGASGGHGHERERERERGGSMGMFGRMPPPTSHKVSAGVWDRDVMSCITSLSLSPPLHLSLPPSPSLSLPLPSLSLSLPPSPSLLSPSVVIPAAPPPHLPQSMVTMSPSTPWGEEGEEGEEGASTTPSPRPPLPPPSLEEEATDREEASPPPLP